MNGSFFAFYSNQINALQLHSLYHMVLHGLLMPLSNFQLNKNSNEVKIYDYRIDHQIRILWSIMQFIDSFEYFPNELFNATSSNSWFIWILSSNFSDMLCLFPQTLRYMISILFPGIFFSSFEFKPSLDVFDLIKNFLQSNIFLRKWKMSVLYSENNIKMVKAFLLWVESLGEYY